MRLYESAEHGDHGEDEAEPVKLNVAIKFLGTRGISLDWIFSGDVGGLITHAAASSERAALSKPLLKHTEKKGTR